AIIHQRAGHELTAIVVDDPFHQASADPLRESPNQLPVNSNGFDHGTGIIDPDDLFDFKLARLFVDGDSRQHGAARPCFVRVIANIRLQEETAAALSGFRQGYIAPANQLLSVSPNLEAG